MNKAWRVIGIIILVLVVAGVVAGGIGLLTGASLDRMVENVFGGWDGFWLLLDVLGSELGINLPF